MIMYYQTKFGCKRISSSKHALSYFGHSSSCIMMHHNTKFGNKMLGGLDNIIRANMNILIIHCGLDPECSNPTFSQDTLAYDDVTSDQVWLPSNQQFRKYSRKNHILFK